ncbi:MAG: hypothetical protein MZV64_42585 [Ignavibacteriales bacterium]|nr:hypothetical protein [Ignavibacteriales bacterium]
MAGAGRRGGAAGPDRAVRGGHHPRVQAAVPAPAARPRRTSRPGALRRARPRRVAGALGAVRPPPPQARARPQAPAGQAAGARSSAPVFRGGANFVRGRRVRDEERRARRGPQGRGLRDLRGRRPAEGRDVRVREDPDRRRRRPRGWSRGRCASRGRWPRTRGRGCSCCSSTPTTSARASAVNVRRPLINMLNRLAGPEDLIALMTPDMAASDITFTRRTDKIADLIDRAGFWGQRNELIKKDPIDQMYEQCYPPEAGSGRTTSVDRGGDDPAPAREGDARRPRGTGVLPGRAPGGAQGHPARQRGLAAVPPEPGPGGERHAAAARRLRGAGRPDHDVRPAQRSPAWTPVAMRPGPRGAGADRQRAPLPRHPAGGQPVERELLSRSSRAASSCSTPTSARTRRRRSTSDFAMLRQRHETLKTAALDTDGIAVMDSNDINAGLQRVVSDLSSLLPARLLLDQREGRRPLPDDPGAREAAGHRRARAQGLPGADRGRGGEAGGAVGGGAARPTRSGGDRQGRRVARRHQGERRVPPDGQRRVVDAGGRAGEGPAAGSRAGAVDPGRGGPEGPRRRGLGATAGRRTSRSRPRAAPRLSATRCPIPAGDEPASSRASRAPPRTCGSTPAPTCSACARSPPAAAFPPPTPRASSVPPAPGTARLVMGQPAYARRLGGPNSEELPTADRRFRRTERLIVQASASMAPDSVTAELLDRSGKALPLPVTASVVEKDFVRWARAELVLAPLARGRLPAAPLARGAARSRW